MRLQPESAGGSAVTNYNHKLVNTGSKLAIDTSGDDFWQTRSLLFETDFAYLPDDVELDFLRGNPSWLTEIPEDYTDIACLFLVQ